MSTNGVVELGPIAGAKVRREDLLLAMLSDLGCSVGSMPSEVEGDVDWNGRWEGFDPEKVEDPDLLEDPWASVFELHNRPDMGDCRTMRFRYVHTPETIMPDYPKVPLRGVFGLCDPEVEWENVTGADLIHVGSELPTP